jgi:hypothetical protein
VELPLEYSLGTKPQQAHELAGAGEPAPVGDLAGQGQRAQAGDTPVGSQPGHLVGERWPPIPGGQVGLDGLQLGVAGVQGGPVVVIGGGQRGVVEALGHQPALMGVGPGRPGPEHPAVAQQELTEAMPGPGAIGEQVGAGAAQIPHRLLGHGRDADGHPARRRGATGPAAGSHGYRS